MSAVEEFWEAELNGVWYSLHSHARHVTSIGGSRTDVPDLRGENVAIAYRAGRTHNAKTPDQRVVTLAGWVSSVQSDGTPYPAGAQAGFNENWRLLRRLLWRPDGTLFGLRRSWYDVDGTLLTATAQAEYGGNLVLSDDTPDAGKFAVDLVLPDPYFYGPEQTVGFVLDTPVVVENVGDVPTYKITGGFHDQLQNPIITNATPNPDNWFKVGTSLAAGDDLAFDVDAFGMVRASDGASLSGAVTRSGARHWLGLLPGNNTLTLTATSGNGTADITFAPAYF